MAAVADRASRCPNGVGMGTALSPGSPWRHGDRTSGGCSRGDCNCHAYHPWVIHCICLCRCRHCLLAGARATGSRSGMDCFRRALGGASLHLPAVARKRRTERSYDAVVGSRHRMGDRYRGVCDRQDPRWPAARAPLESAQNVGGTCGRRGVRRRSPAGPPQHGSGFRRPCRSCSLVRALRLSSSSAILPSLWLSAGSA